MSYIQFESEREKEKIRQELREARDKMLETAKRGAEERAQRKAQKELSGETNWMLPSVAEKIEKLSKLSKVSKKSRKKDKKSKSKKSSKKRKQRSSTDDDSDSASDSSEEQKKSRKKSGKHKKNRKRKYSDSSSDTEESSSESSDDGAAEQKKSRKKSSKHKKNRKRKDSEDTSESGDNPKSKSSTSANLTEPSQSVERPQQRDSWMTDALMLKTYSRERVEKKPNEKQHIDTYDPAKSSRELNPYWKSTGTGLPSFQKPTDDSDDQQVTSLRSRGGAATSTTRNWQKKTNDDRRSESQSKTQRQISPSESSTSASESEPEPERRQSPSVVPVPTDTSHFLTDQQMNELGAKILKAEIMGNANLAAELTKKLEDARSNRAAFKEKSAQKVTNTEKKTKDRNEEEHILLTHTDERGNCRPLSKTLDPRDLYGGRSSQKKKKRVETHVDGERVRFFADDDKYDIKQMFEREKYSTAADSNLQFADIASKHKNPNDDLEDIFADKIRRNISKEDTDKKELHRAIHDHQKMAAQLENCDKCFDSPKMDKKLLICMGETAYLALPWYIGLQPGHCVIVPTQHVSCCTQLDENTWEEINNFRKAITRMFAAQRKDVIFFEIANKLQRRPHLTIHCIPISATHGEMAPFYFKKAIEESEHEWSVNKQLVSLRNKGLRSCIPKGLPYFWVNFGMDSGFAHVIEDENRFPANFAVEIIGGMLHLDANKWRKQQKEQNIIAKVKRFADDWKKFDCTS